MTGVLIFACGVVALNLYALLLVLGRAWLFRVPVYRPMLLNIALSISPAVAMLMILGGMLLAIALGSAVVMFIALFVLGACWLLLLPNAAYLITELNFSHRDEDDPVPLWYDIVMTLTLALSGVMNTLANVALAQLMVLIMNDRPGSALANPIAWVVVACVIVLVSFGIYLGRYIRFNSWDLAHPWSFAVRFFTHFRSGTNVRAALGFVITHSLFLGILYVLVSAPLIAALVNA